MWLEKFRANLEFAWHYATTWVSAAWFAAFSYWGTLDKGERTDLIGSFLPVGAVPWVMLIAAAVSYQAAKGWPQPKLQAKLQQKQFDDAVEAERTP